VRFSELNKYTLAVLVGGAKTYPLFLCNCTQKMDDHDFSSAAISCCTIDGFTLSYLIVRCHKLRLLLFWEGVGRVGEPAVLSTAKGDHCNCVI